MKTKTLALSLVLVALPLFGGGAYLLARPGGPEAPVTTSGGEGTTPASSVAASRFDRARAPGVRHTYAARFDQDVALSSAAGRAQSAGVRIRLTGDLTLAFVGHFDGRHRLFAELSNAALEIGARSKATEAVEKELGRPFYVLTEPDGRVRGYSFERGLSETAQNLLRGLVGGAQIAMRDERAWTAEEDDIQGSYVASYTRGEGGEIVKTKGRYQKVATMTSLVPEGEDAAVDGRARAVAMVGEDGWLTKLDLEEHRTATMGPNMPAARTDARLELRLTSTRLDPSLLGRFEREEGAFADAVPFGTGNDEAAQRSADARLAAGLGMDALLAKARATESDAEMAALSDQMAARLRLDPAEADRMVPLAKTLPDREGRTLVGALGAAGTREGVRALGKIVGLKGAPPGVRAQAATQLAFSGEHALDAREPLTEGMSDASREVRESSALALGNVARELGDSDGDSVAELVRRYEEAQTDEDRILLLRALGNSGSAEVLPIARRALSSESEPLRETAAQALRFLPVGEADAILSQVVAGDPAEGVRLSAVDAIGYRIVEMHIAAFERAIAESATGRIRGAIAEVAARALSTRGKTLTPAAREALEGLIRKTA